jgi:hypothetical protein
MPRHERSHIGRDCYPRPEVPADQPHTPGCGSECCGCKAPDPPCLPCLTPWHPDPDCHCPPLPSMSPKCIEVLIDDQSKEEEAANNANQLKQDLTIILEETTKGREGYTREFHEDHIKRWVKLDCNIADLLRSIECNVECWKCVLNCYVCPLFADLDQAEQELYGGEELYRDVHDLYDLQYWRSKYRDKLQRRYDRINDYLEVWKDPVKHITQVLDDNESTYKDISNYPCKESGKAIFDVFLKLVPLHLAIAPPRGSCWETRIDKRFTDFCDFGGEPDDHCCGPDLGKLSLRQRLIKPQPYLIDPCDYLKLICCLMEQRWTPARIARDEAISEYNAVTRKIERLKGKFNDWQATLETTAEGAIPTDVECCEFEPHQDCDDDDDCDPRRRRRRN